MKRIAILTAHLCAYLGLWGQLGTHSQHLKIDQFGYPPDVRKVCVISNPVSGFNSGESYDPGSTLQVMNATNDSLVYSGTAVSWNSGSTYAQSGDQLWWFDFSALTTPGSYYIYDPTNDKHSFDFNISPGVYNEILKQAVRVFFYQRSGFAKDSAYADDWWDGASHLGPLQDLDCRLATNPVASTTRSLEGGWFDAGDFNKYVNFAYEPLHDLLLAYLERPQIWTDNYNLPESGNGIPDLLDEIKWEMDWLRRMQESNGSVLMKVSVTQWQSASPPSTDNAERRYGPAQASATRTAASCFALAAIAFDLAGMTDYADSLEDHAIDAWDWLVANPAYSYYNNAGFSSANPELSEYGQLSSRVGAAVTLFARTGNTTYRDYVDNNYASIQPILWTSWYPFENTIQDLLLYYASLPNATSPVASAIDNSFQASLQNSGQLNTAIDDSLGGYCAYLYSHENVWGSNRVRCHLGSMFYNVIEHSLDPDTQYYRDAALGFLNFQHGVNPIHLTMLTNMGAWGAEQSANEMYHAWFGHGTPYDNAQTSPIGPAPGYLTGGFNQYYAPDPSYGGTIEPPQNQPPMKSYLDWNTSWPENSWEITEPSISYQAAYVKLLSKFVSESTCSLNVTSSQDDGPGTLRSVVSCASPGDTILITVDTVHISSSPLVIDKQLVILGQNNPVLQAATPSMAFDVLQSGNLGLVDLMVLREGLFIQNSGSTILDNVTVASFGLPVTTAISSSGSLILRNVIGLD